MYPLKEKSLHHNWLVWKKCTFCPEIHKLETLKHSLRKRSATSAINAKDELWTEFQWPESELGAGSHGAHKNSWDYHTEADQSIIYYLFGISVMLSLQASQLMTAASKYSCLQVSLVTHCINHVKIRSLVTHCKEPSECWKVCAFFLNLLVHTDFIVKSSVCDIPTLTGFKTCLPGTVLGSFH